MVLGSELMKNINISGEERERDTVSQRNSSMFHFMDSLWNSDNVSFYTSGWVSESAFLDSKSTD